MDDNQRTFWLDLTYGFQDHPILLLPDEQRPSEGFSCGDSYCDGCPFQKRCTHWESVVWAGLKLETIKSRFPERLSFSEVKGSHSGQTSLLEMFKTYTF